MNPLYIVTAAMFGQMSMNYMAQLALPVVAPSIAADLGIDPGLIGIYSGMIYGLAMFSVNAVGPLIDRFGALRVGQIGLSVMGAGIALAAVGWMSTFVASAIITALGLSMCTPSSSQVVGQFCAPRQAPLFFSIKQTGVPIGGLIAGMILPLVVDVSGWRGAVLFAGFTPILLAICLQPLRGRVDTGPRVGGTFSFRRVLRTLTLVVTHTALRRIMLAGMAFVGLQSAYGSYFVTFLVDGLGHDLAFGGKVFAIANVSALFTRILWGVAGGIFPAQRVLAVLAVLMVAASVMTGAYTDSWSTAAMMAGAALFGATAFSWQGVLLAEIARLAPDGRVGEATGGVMVFIYIGMMSYPLIYGGILALSGSYAFGFHILAVPALACAVMLMRPMPVAASEDQPR